MSDPVVLLSTGDVVGPAGGVTDNSMVLFSGTSGKLIKGNNAQVTSAGLALLDDIDANAQLTTLGLTTTQPQFDNSVKQATTEFVQRALGNFSTSYLLNSNTTLTASAAGSDVELYGASSFTTTLPLISAVTSQTAIRILNLSTKVQTIACQGSEQFLYYGGSSTSITLLPGDSVEVHSFNGWVVMGGSKLLEKAGSFGAALGYSGYQKLPTGWIIQWGSALIGTTATVITFPIAFPNARVSFGVNNNSQPSFTVSATGSGRSGFNAIANMAGQTCTWFAIGY